MKIDTRMAGHLSAAQLDALLLPGRDAGEEDAEPLAQHLRECPACSAELAELRASFGLFRDAATAVAARHHALARIASLDRRAEREALASGNVRCGGLRWPSGLVVYAPSIHLHEPARVVARPGPKVWQRSFRRGAAAGHRPADFRFDPGSAAGPRPGFPFVFTGIVRTGIVSSGIVRTGFVRGQRFASCFCLAQPCPLTLFS